MPRPLDEEHPYMLHKISCSVCGEDKWHKALQDEIRQWYECLKCENKIFIAS